jgi:hypothetical protein
MNQGWNRTEREGHFGQATNESQAHACHRRPDPLRTRGASNKSCAIDLVFPICISVFTVGSELQPNCLAYTMSMSSAPPYNPYSVQDRSRTPYPPTATHVYRRVSSPGGSSSATRLFAVLVIRHCRIRHSALAFNLRTSTCGLQLPEERPCSMTA